MKKILKGLAVLLSITTLMLPITISATERRVLIDPPGLPGVSHVYAESTVYCKTVDNYVLTEEDFADFDIEYFGGTPDAGLYGFHFATFEEAFRFIDTVSTNENIAKAEIYIDYTHMLTVSVHIEGDELVFDGYPDIDEDGNLIYYIPEDVEVTRVKIPDIREIIAAENAALKTITYGDIDDDSKFANITDIVLLGKHLSGKLTLSEDSQSYKNANCDLRDDAVNIDDLRAMIDFMTGAIDSLPVTE